VALFLAKSLLTTFSGRGLVARRSGRAAYFCDISGIGSADQGHAGRPAYFSNFNYVLAGRCAPRGAGALSFVSTRAALIRRRAQHLRVHW
jgi:hypothetical protein